MLRKFLFAVFMSCVLLSPLQAKADVFLPVEHKIAGLHYERAIAWDDQGHQLFDVIGGPHSTLLSFNWQKNTIAGVPVINLWSGVITHNHPSGNPTPSYADAEFAWYWNLREFRVVSGNKLRIMRRTGKFWNPPPVFLLSNPITDAAWEAVAADDHFEYIEVN